MSDPYTRYFNAHSAWKAAKNPVFKDYWWKVMKHFMSQFEVVPHGS